MRCVTHANVSVIHMKESCHTLEWVVPHTWMCGVTHMNASCHTPECVMSHTWMHHVTLMNASCLAYEKWIVYSLNMILLAIRKNYKAMEKVTFIFWYKGDGTGGRESWYVMADTWMRRVTHMNASCHTHERVISRVWKINDLCVLLFFLVLV